MAAPEGMTLRAAMAMHLGDTMLQPPMLEHGSGVSKEGSRPSRGRGQAAGDGDATGRAVRPGYGTEASASTVSTLKFHSQATRTEAGVVEESEVRMLTLLP